MIEIESQVLYFYPGAYRNFDEVETSLTQEELILMYQKAYELKREEHRFIAAMQGIDLDENEDQESETERVIRRAEAKALGMTEEQVDHAGIFTFTYEDDEE